MNLRLISLFASAMLISFGLSAQPQGNERPRPPKMKSPEEIAKKEADRMKAEIALTDKQYKKVYKLIKKDWEYRQDQAKGNFGGGMPPQGGPGGFPGGGMMGGGGFSGGGMMGGPGGFSGERPQGMGERGQRPDFAPGKGPGETSVSEEYLEKQDKKLKKILTAEQYTQWRAKHPAEHLDLPPMELK